MKWKCEGSRAREVLCNNKERESLRKCFSLNTFMLSKDKVFSKQENKRGVREKEREGRIVILKINECSSLVCSHRIDLNSKEKQI